MTKKKKTIKEAVTPMTTSTATPVRSVTTTTSPTTTQQQQNQVGAVVDSTGKMITGRMATDDDLKKTSGQNQVTKTGELSTGGKAVTWNDLKAKNSGAVVDANGNVIIGRSPTKQEIDKNAVHEQVEKRIRRRVYSYIQENFWNIYKSFEESYTQSLDFDDITDICGNMNHPYNTAARCFMQHLTQGQIAMHIAAWMKKNNKLEGSTFAYKDELAVFLKEHTKELSFSIDRGFLVVSFDLQSTNPTVHVIVKLFYSEDGWLKHVNVAMGNKKPELEAASGDDKERYLKSVPHRITRD